MANPASIVRQLARPFGGAGAVANAARQSQDHQRLTRCDLIIFERTGQVAESLIRLAQDDPDHLKALEPPDGLIETIDRILLARMFARDLAEWRSGGKLTNRLEVAAMQIGYLDSLGLPADELSLLRSRIDHPSNR